MASSTSAAPELERPLEQTLAAAKARLIDLAECEFIDSTGIALIVRAWQRLDKNGETRATAEWCSAAATNRSRRVLEITGLERSIPVHGSRDEALAAQPHPSLPGVTCVGGCRTGYRYRCRPPAGNCPVSF